MDTTLKDIENVFSAFHDGSIEEYQGDLSKLTLTISCQYLAQGIDPGFENFYLDFTDVTKLDFQSWGDESVIFNKWEYLNTDLDISSASIESDYVSITCYQHDPDQKYPGGQLMISAKDMVLRDHDKRKLALEELYSISKKYWKRLR